MTVFLGRLWRVLSSPQFLTMFIIPNAAFWTLTWLVPNGIEITLLNLALIGLSTAVLVAYGHHIVSDIIDGRRPDSTYFISVGIFYSFLRHDGQPVFSLIWRWLGEPQWLVNSDIVCGLLFYGIMAACLHLSAPYAINGRVPETRWVKIGAIAGVAIVAGLLLMHASDLADEWKRYTTPNDHAPSPTSLVQPL